MADVAFTFLIAILGALVTANAALVVARLTHRSRLAGGIERVASRFTWAFRLGGR